MQGVKTLTKAHFHVRELVVSVRLHQPRIFSVRGTGAHFTMLQRRSLSKPRFPAAPTGIVLERSVTSVATSSQEGPRQIAYELVQGTLVKFSHDSAQKTPPTAVLVHGIMGSRRNMLSFAQMITKAFPSWQVLLVDLRCHGESALTVDSTNDHSVNAAAGDIIALLRRLKLFPHSLIGHSFGGKVVMSMVQQFGAVLPRPVQVWVLDALPGDVRSGGLQGQDKPADIIKYLQALPMPVHSRSELVDYLSKRGVSLDVARWLTTNLRPATQYSNSDGPTPLTWSFDLEGIAALFRSYESSSLWPLLESPPQGLKLDFVKAEGSSFRWSSADEDRISSLGFQVHLLRNSGHWVHADNPTGLFEIMAPSFSTALKSGPRR